MSLSKTAQTTLFAILFLFFLQVLSDFIDSIYAFGLLVTAFTIEIAAVLLLFTPLILLFLRKPPGRAWIIALAALALLGRLLEAMLNPGGKLVACGVSVGAFLLLFPSLLASRPADPSLLAAALLIAASLSAFLRTAGSSLDLSESGIYQFIGWVLAALAGRLMWRHEELAEVQGKGPARLPGTPRIIGLCIGLAAVILMIYFAFASPTVIARWTAYSYAAIVAVFLYVLTGFALLLAFTDLMRKLSPATVVGWNVLFVLALVLTILPHQVAFPANAGAYPLDGPPTPTSATSAILPLPLILMLLLSPVLFVDFMLYIEQLRVDQPSIRQLGIGFGLAALYLLVMVFFHVFTTIYDYASLVGPLFRDRFWLVYLLAGLGLALPVLLVHTGAYVGGGAPQEGPSRPRYFVPAVVGALALLSVGALYVTGPNPVPPRASHSLRVMTYNIQQGYDQAGNKNLTGQLGVIRQVAPDILGLQESDTARVANGNVDAVRYYSDNLDMYSYYGPTTTTGTFGIALLSKYPIEDVHTFFMYSPAEQTAAIQARIIVGGRTYNVFVTHLGNGGPVVQLQDVLKRVDGLPNVILMGDFNFNPSTEQYRLASQSLADAWLLRWPGGKDIPGLGPEGRIDQLFLSHDLSVIDVEYVVDPDSDHPYLYGDLRP